MFGKILAVIISAVLAALCVTVAVSANLLDTKDGKIYCTDDNGNKLTGWQTIDENKYYFKKDGSAVTKNTTIACK